VRQFENIFVAHNGSGFDYRFIFDKLTPYAKVEIVGGLKDMKELKFLNIRMLDSILLIRGSLKNIANDLKCENKKLPFDIVGVTKNNWVDQIDKILKYCRQDCIVLYELYNKYIFERATLYFNNKRFPTILFPQT